MLQYKTLLAESKTPLLLAQKEIASLQKELDSFRKAVDAKAKEKDAMERAAKFAKAETEKVRRRRPCAVDARRLAAAESRRRRRAPAMRPRARHRRDLGAAALGAAQTRPRPPSDTRDRIERETPRANPERPRIEAHVELPHRPRSRSS